jgi:hypothetical protein
VINLKKILVAVLALAIIAGVGATIQKVSDNCGEPPIGDVVNPSNF